MRSPHSPVDLGRHTERLGQRARALVVAIREGDEADVEQAVLRLSRQRWWLAPLPLAVGAIAMLLEGVRLVFSDWRLMLVQVLPAMWIWLAMFDLKVHALHGRSFHVLTGAPAILAGLAIIALTIASSFLNAVLAFAIVAPDDRGVRRGVTGARGRFVPVVASGTVLGVLLAVATLVVPRWGRPWFGLSLSVVVGLMMLCYVAIPARLIGVRSRRSAKDKMIASALTGAVGAALSAPAYLLGRVGLLMLGSSLLLVPGILIFLTAVALQAGATGAIKTVKLSTALLAGQSVGPGPATSPETPADEQQDSEHGAYP